MLLISTHSALFLCSLAELIIRIKEKGKKEWLDNQQQKTTAQD